jgi:hypothetical protein
MAPPDQAEIEHRKQVVTNVSNQLLLQRLNACVMLFTSSNSELMLPTYFVGSWKVV